MERFTLEDHWPLVAGAISTVVAIGRFALRRRRAVSDPHAPHRFARFIGRTISANILLRVERLERVAQQEEMAALKRENKLLRQRRTTGGSDGRSGSGGTIPAKPPLESNGQPTRSSAGSEQRD